MHPEHEYIISSPNSRVFTSCKQIQISSQMCFTDCLTSWLGQEFLLSGSGYQNSSCQVFPFLQKGDFTSGHPVVVYMTKFEVRLVQLCPNLLTSHKTIMLKGMYSGTMGIILFLHFFHCDQCRGTTHLALIIVFQNSLRKRWVPKSSACTIPNI